MTRLRKMMLEELQLRNYAETTIDCYIRALEDFSRYFNCSPDRLGPRHIREYQAALFQKRKFSPNTVAQHLAALRFFYVKTLKKVWSVTETPSPLALQNKKVIYDLLFRASAETLLEVARDPRHLGAEIGFFSVLHTWNQKLDLHPHVHCVVPAGGLSADHTHWIKTRYAFFLPVKVLSRVFRGKFVAALKRTFRDGQLQFHGVLALLAQPKTFSSWLRPLFRKDWVVYSKRPFGGPQHVLHYLGRYTHRVAISNHRLISFADGKVTFRWRDSAHHNEQKPMPLALDEFLRRFLLHLLPEGFVRIRNFGFLANRKRATHLPLCFQLLGSAATPPTEQDRSGANNASDLWRCPKCSGPMMVVERLTAAEIQLRSPPVLTTAA
jgi:putative transposase/integrase-like protein